MYQKPELTIEMFDIEDVITLSEPTPKTDPWQTEEISACAAPII